MLCYYYTDRGCNYTQKKPIYIYFLLFYGVGGKRASGSPDGNQSQLLIDIYNIKRKKIRSQSQTWEFLWRGRDYIGGESGKWSTGHWTKRGSTKTLTQILHNHSLRREVLNCISFLRLSILLRNSHKNLHISTKIARAREILMTITQ